MSIYDDFCIEIPQAPDFEHGSTEKRKSCYTEKFGNKNSGHKNDAYI